MRSTSPLVFLVVRLLGGRLRWVDSSSGGVAYRPVDGQLLHIPARLLECSVRQLDVNLHEPLNRTESTLRANCKIPTQREGSQLGCVFCVKYNIVNGSISKQDLVRLGGGNSLLKSRAHSEIVPPCTMAFLRCYNMIICASSTAECVHRYCRFFLTTPSTINLLTSTSTTTSSTAITSLPLFLLPMLLLRSRNRRRALASVPGESIASNSAF